MSTSKQVSVGNTPTLIYQSDGPNPETVLLQAAAAGVTLGGPNVAAGQGPGCPAAPPLLPIVLYEDSIYGITAGAAINVEVLTFLSGSGR